MKAFRSVTSTAVVLDRLDVDTDQIIPKQFLKRIERTGFGEFLFFDWRKDPDFELNTQQGKILLAGRNFGCGSSREHAPWALQDYGFEAIVAPSYGDIFRQNSLKTGLLPVQLPPDQVKALMERARAGEELTVDLEARIGRRLPVRARRLRPRVPARGPRRHRPDAPQRGRPRRLRGVPPRADLDARARVAPARAPSGSRTRRPLQALSAALLSAFSSRSAAASPTVHGVFESTALLTGLLLPR